MPKEMKLIMENWRSSVLSEQEELSTVGDLRAALQAHRAAEAGKEAGKEAMDIILGALPGVGNIYTALKGTKTAVSALNKIYGADDKFKSNTGLDVLNVDDNVSRIVDNTVEVKFLNYYANLISDMDDDELLPNATSELQDFLKTNFNDNTVKK